MKASEWLMPLALDFAGIIPLSSAFGLGRAALRRLAVSEPQPAAPQPTKRQLAARKAWATRCNRANLRTRTLTTGRAALKAAR
jgi:hypothetical protein